MYQWGGMGDANTDAGIVQAGAGVAAPVVTGLLASGAASSAAAGGTGLILGMAPALAVPVIGAAIAAVAIVATLLIKNSGCGVTCVETSSWANQAATVLGQNIAAYFSLPVPRSQSSQAQALATFDSIWATLQQQCGQPGTGNAGVRCITDRQAGACTWHQTADKVPAWGTPAAGECWNWFNGYRDPIANDPNVASDATATAANPAAYVSSALSSLTGGSSSGLLLLLAAGLGIYLIAK